MARKTWPDGHPYQGGHTIYRGLRYAIYLRDKLRCVYCRADCWTVEHERGGFTLDHVVPVAEGGRDHSPDNLVTCCMECNRRKSSKSPAEAFGKQAALRALAALSREMPSKLQGLALWKRRQREGSRVSHAHAKGWLDRATVAMLEPLLPGVDVRDSYRPPPDYVPDDDIPF